MLLPIVLGLLLPIVLGLIVLCTFLNYKKTKKKMDGGSCSSTSKGNWVHIDDDVQMLEDPCDNDVVIVDACETSINNKRRKCLDTPGNSRQCEHHGCNNMVITSCHHDLCKICIQSSLVLKDIQLDTAEGMYRCIASKLLCPICGDELPKKDILMLFDSDFVKTYESMLERSYMTQYSIAMQGGSSTCLKCSQQAIICNKGKAMIICDSVKLQPPPFWSCKTCGFIWCAGCGMSISNSRSSRKEPPHACKETTNYSIYKVIANLESMKNNCSNGTTKSSDEKFVAEKVSRKSETIWKSGTGFGGHEGEEFSFENTRKVEMQMDKKIKCLLSSLTDILNIRPMNQHETFLGFSTFVILSRNDILIQVLDYYMTNDSMMDICERSDLYFQLASVLTAVWQYSDFLPILAGSYSEINSNDYGSGRNSFISKMKNIYDQSKMVVSRFNNTDNDKEVASDIGIAKCMLECYNGLMSALKKGIPNIFQEIFIIEDSLSVDLSDESASDNEEVSKNEITADPSVGAYKKSLKPLQFMECSLTQVAPKLHASSAHYHNPKNKGKSIDNSGIHNKKRMLYIAKDLANLSTSLPLEWESSIHVRVDPVKTELLKALIVGPKGTPYQNGVFLFDIFLPPDYPQVPPSVRFLTTGGGKVRFNPNLYANGNVCLSLLGTWSGPGWEPWKSTLLQVLVSIQSLIFVADPYYNEPGLESTKNSRNAENESCRHRFNTLKLAILGALRQPDPCFKDVIIQHFQHKKAEITEQCYEWSDLHPAGINIETVEWPSHHSVPQNISTNETITSIVEDIISELVKLP